MWAWLTGGHLFGGSSSFLAGKHEFNLATMQLLHQQLVRYRELPDAEIVEILRVLSEFLIYSDQNRASNGVRSPVSLEEIGFASVSSSAAVFFDYFCEKNILSLLVALGESMPSVPVQVQLLQTLSLLVQNISTRTSLYYLLSNNYVNKLIQCRFAVFSDDDVRDWYVTFLKALSLRLNEETVQFFFNDRDDGVFSFPLYVEALKFGKCSEQMIKVAVKTLTLNVLKVQDSRVRRFIVQHENMAYFSDVVECATDLALTIQGLLNQLFEGNPLITSTRRDIANANGRGPNSHGANANANNVEEKLQEAIEEYIDHCFYLQDLLDVNIPELCYKLGDLLYTNHLKNFLAASLLPDCNPRSKRVSALLALYLLTRTAGIFEHVPLVNALSFMLLCPDAPENCLYSSSALGGGARVQSRARLVHKRLDDGEQEESKGEDNENSDDNDDAGGDDTDHVFRAHFNDGACSPFCYLQTRFSYGEWPVKEVKDFGSNQDDSMGINNVYRESLWSLMKSRNELLSSCALQLLLSLMNSEAVDHALLREWQLLPVRFLRHHEKNGSAFASNTAANGRLSPREVLAECSKLNDQFSNCSTASVCSLPSEVLSLHGDHDDEEQKTPAHAGGGDDSDDENEESEDDEDEEEERKPDTPTEVSPSYNLLLAHLALGVLTHCEETRFLNSQLAARLLCDVVVADPANSTVPRLVKDQSQALTSSHEAMLKEVDSSCTHQVMQSMRGAMSDVDLFIYVFEEEFHLFQRSAFPWPLQTKTSSPFEFLLTDSSTKSDLTFRNPLNEIEQCRKSMRVFLLVRKLRQLVDCSYSGDQLERVVSFQNPKTGAMQQHVGQIGLEHAVALDGLDCLPCIWREQRFLPLPAKMLMLLNDEALVFVEKRLEGNSAVGFVKLFVAAHRVYCTIDAKDDLVLHFSISSSTPIACCRGYQKIDVKEGDSSLKSWHVSVLFETREHCEQAKAHIDQCRTVVRALKLLQLEQAFNSHIAVGHSVP